MSSDIHKALQSHIDDDAKGSYFVPDSTLMAMHAADFESANRMIDLVCEANPNYTFSVSDETKDGITIYWSRNV